MSKFVVVDGDTVKFDGPFPPATFTAGTPQTTISGSAKLSSGGKVCVQGDEGKVTMQGVAYASSAGFSEGTGTLTIFLLAPDQVAKKLSVNGTKALLVGSKFTAMFTVSSPATNPQTGPDPVPIYQGTGTFVTSNSKLTSA